MFTTQVNLPVTVTFVGTNKKIDYFYDAVGTKLKKIVTDASSLITTEYAGNYVYETEVKRGSRTPLNKYKRREQNSVLQFFNTAEGYVEPKGTGWEYVFQYKDHLGNVRLSYADSNGDGLITATGLGAEIREENNYYPFGLKHKGYNFVVNGRDHKYGFGNKEEQDELGLGWIDITARNYDPALGRWMNLDPLAEQMRRHSPYNYAFDNPVYFIDPDGMMGCPPGEDCSSKFGIFKLELKETLKTVGKNINNALKDLGKALTPKGGFVLTGGKGDGKKDSISDEPDREAPADAESIDVSPVVALSEAFGPQLEGVAEGTRIATELFKVIDGKTQSGNSSNKGTISDTGNEEDTGNKEVSTNVYSGDTITFKIQYWKDGIINGGPGFNPVGNEQADQAVKDGLSTFPELDSVQKIRKHK